MSMRKTTLHWYHYMLNHPGGDRLENTIKDNFYWKVISNQEKQYVKTFQVCQQHKKKHKYGHVPAKILQDLVPWRTLHIYLIGPYSITSKQSLPECKI